MDYSGFQALQTEKPGGLQSMGSQRVGHNRATFTFTFNAILSLRVKQEEKSLVEGVGAGKSQ